MVAVHEQTHGVRVDFSDGSSAEADIAIVPSVLDESFGNTAVEALLAARPLIVSDIPGLLEATDPATSRVVVPRDDAAAMQFLIPGWKFDNKRPCLVR